LDGWRNALARQYRAIQTFHDQFRAASTKSVSDAGYNYRQRDETAYRAFIDRTLRELSNRISGVIGLALEELFPSKLVARFSDWLLCEGKKPKAVPTAEKIESKLATAFPGSRFRVNVEVTP
jgi:hypothetical protein